MLSTLVVALALSAPPASIPTPTDVGLVAQTQQPASGTSNDQRPADEQKPAEQKAEAKEPPTPEHTGIRALFANLIEDIKHLPAKQNLYLAGLGGGLAGAAHP